jgi:formylmethanofuran dehydrogenase subunit E
MSFWKQKCKHEKIELDSTLPFKLEDYSCYPLFHYTDLQTEVGKAVLLSFRTLVRCDKCNEYIYTPGEQTKIKIIYRLNNDNIKEK